MKMSKSENKRVLYWKDIILPNEHINIEKLSKQLAYETIIHTPALDNIITKCLHIVHNEPNLLFLEDPVIVIGDVHGQFYDLLNILSHCNALKNDFPLKTKLVFLGDYVDRGINSMQVMIMLMALKIEYSANIILLRGNHESRVMTQQYNFRHQCYSKYSQGVYESILDVFNAMPIACIVNREYFCVHGGISDKMTEVAKINTINRYKEITLQNDAFCDFIWSDPIDKQNGKVGKKAKHNTQRDCSIVYGVELVNEFLIANDLTTIIRGHEVFLEGYKTYAWNGSKQPPPVITVFSAPNYCGTCGNKGAVAWIENNNIKIKQFREQEPQKYKFLVKFDVFSWTLPEILSNVRQITMELMDIMIEMHIPELQSETQENSLAMLVKYAYDQKLIEHTKIKDSLLNPRESMTPEEERNYLFNRSQEYYANSQKVPKHQ